MRSVKHIGLGILAFILGTGVCWVFGLLWCRLFTFFDPAHPPRSHFVVQTVLGLLCTAMVVIVTGMLGWAAKSIGEEIEFRYHNWKNK